MKIIHLDLQKSSCICLKKLQFWGFLPPRPRPQHPWDVCCWCHPLQWHTCSFPSLSFHYLVAILRSMDPQPLLPLPATAWQVIQRVGIHNWSDFTHLLKRVLSSCPDLSFLKHQADEEASAWCSCLCLFWCPKNVEYYQTVTSDGRVCVSRGY